MKEDPLVTVIIACYNGERFIDRCISALINQTYQNIEIIICDDCSTDNSLQMCRKWESMDHRVKVLHNEKNMYSAYSRNRCIEKAEGEYVVIQDIDDVSKPDRIERLVRHIKDKKVDFVGASMEIIDNPSLNGKVLRKENKKPTKYSFLKNFPFFHPTMIFSKKCLEHVGGYRVAPETRRGQDYDMVMRLYAAGYKGVNVDEVLYLYCLDESNIKRRSFSARLGEMKIRAYGYKKMKIFFPLRIFCLLPLALGIVDAFHYGIGYRNG
jgi:glycosyltransferase EpsE